MLSNNSPDVNRSYNFVAFVLFRHPGNKRRAVASIANAKLAFHFFIGDVGGEVTIDVFSRSAIFNFA